ncbi:bifunctional 2-polyprenyl-6-hydroxyphenol methylase/3-demethylubiquinol 3-O-methyltransferase UbiG [Nocardia terpenica]|uniref:3-demethylubiquinone-9 3-O-methyltransferase n=1 Tax=Nocardia terpenica TaxID=455432 RepID=A0A6G9ZAU6_9NOCA|nr:bifunctional 2-polyprenyl-6-hydroxyphenol methylase/3-demethylubiquinol 3-O-methyltransferase UbiG [Nocardia terpenica]QIS22133.1 3-demethylubiquinone-9 3-O-methyltransferase [Nocardia terpenica]
MAVDNEVYNEPGAWWDDRHPFGLLMAYTPARFGYFKGLLTGLLGLELEELRVLDVGCGGGVLAEAFAGAGCAVTGVDPSQPSLDAARAHARDSGRAIRYQPASAEELPFPDASFDVVYCCDVLEHVSDLNAAIGEAARVLKPGGYYLYDTINRTLRSKLIMIKMAQEWPGFRFVPADLHDWNKFIKPSELLETFRRNGLDNLDLVGLGPGRGPFETFKLLRRRARGEITYGELGRQLDLKVVSDISVMYAGYAQKS